MAALEAQAFGEKRDNYVSSSEDEDEREYGGASASNIPPPDCSDGLPQTGPKGVLIDYYRSQLEEEQTRKETSRKHREEITKKAATVKTWREEHELDPALDPFIQQYRAQRLQEMKEQTRSQRTRLVFGSLMEIRGDKYANVIDSAHAETFVVMHIYDDFLLSCKKMNDSLIKLAKAYQTVKFCRVQSHQLGVSHAFTHSGLPALLVYKNKELVGNLLKVTDSIGEDFCEEDVEAFLRDHNCLPSDDEDERFLNPIACQIAKKLSITSTGGTESD